ncbi:hypothetical protein Hanom_Chr05g00428421 [Helianthus anomalus]
MVGVEGGGGRKVVASAGGRCTVGKKLVVGDWRLPMSFQMSSIGFIVKWTGERAWSYYYLGRESYIFHPYVFVKLVIRN